LPISIQCRIFGCEVEKSTTVREIVFIHLVCQKVIGHNVVQCEVRVDAHGHRFEPWHFLGPHSIVWCLGGQGVIT
jgi:hypothetical protein